MVAAPDGIAVTMSIAAPATAVAATEITSLCDDVRNALA
jgi:hypothetical protein